MEPVITIKVRQQDEAIVSGILASCAAQYKEKIGKDVQLKIDKDNYLPANTCGGIELQAQRDRIKISNTLESRLDLIAQQLLPEIRCALFGRNPNRKFAD